jgi:FlaG/FlaF family flagellin (archaellin)
MSDRQIMSGTVKELDVRLSSNRGYVAMSNSGGQAFNTEEFTAQQGQMWDNAAAGWEA